MVARAKVFFGAENTATRSLGSEEQELGSMMVVLSPGLRNTVMFVVESQEMSGNLACRKKSKTGTTAVITKSLHICGDRRLKLILNLNIGSFEMA